MATFPPGPHLVVIIDLIALILACELSKELGDAGVYFSFYFAHSAALGPTLLITSYQHFQICSFTHLYILIDIYVQIQIRFMIMFRLTNPTMNQAIYLVQ